MARTLGAFLAVIVVLHPGAAGADQWTDWVNSAKPAPPCKNGASRCPAWARDWRNRTIPAGAFVTDLGVIVPPEPSSSFSFLYNWQTLITGGLAIFAALIGAGAAFYVGRSQVAEGRRRERRQALCLSVALMPELFELQANHERARHIIGIDLLNDNLATRMTASVAELVLAAKIDVPTLLNRSTDRVYTLDRAGTTLLQLLSVTIQYNRMIDIIAARIRADVSSFNPIDENTRLTPYLIVIGDNISAAQRELAPLHNAATG